ncbi:MAG: hypothetical protein QXP22_00460 [Candidatus Anstonellales archaeon]
MYNITLTIISILFILFPGIIAAFFYFRKNTIVERLLIGAFSSYVFISFLGFLLLFFGINFNMVTAYAVLIFTYIIAIFIALKYKASINDLINIEKEKQEIVISVIIIAILYIGFIIRLTSLTPIFYELDPYYYLYVTVQILNYGNLPLNDQTAWWPVVNVSHRTIPGLGFYQALVYVINEGKTTVDVYKLPFYASFYPPLISVFMGFFIYLAFKTRFSTFSSLLASLIFITTPGIVAKTQAGLFEAQPNGFLFHIVALSLIYLSIVDRQYLPLLFLSFIGYMPLANTQVQVSVFYIIILTLFLYFEKNEREFFLIYIGYAISNLLFAIFNIASLSLKYMVIYVALPIILLLSLLFKDRIKGIIQDKKINAQFKFIIAFIALLAIYPAFILLNDLFVGIATYSVPLVRTIAEQNPAGESLGPLLGIVGVEFKEGVMQLFAPLAELVELIFSSLYKIAETVFGYNIIYIDKIPNLIFIILLFLTALFIKNIYDFLKKKQSLDYPLFLIYAFFLPIAFLGILKAKFAIQLALASGLAGAFAFSYAFVFVESLIKKFFINVNYQYFASLLLLLLMSFIVLQLNIGGIAYIPFAAAEKPGFNNLYKNAMPNICDDNICSFENFNLTIGQLCLKDTGLSYLCKLYKPETSVLSFCSSDKQYLCNLANGNAKIWDMFSQSNCVMYFVLSYNINEKNIKYVYNACPSSLPKEWLEAMEFINTLPKDAKITSWWDYGHWINYFGQRNAVIRNDHISLDMIGDIAHAYIMANMTDFNKITKYYGSDYALFDREILFAGDAFGGKFYALNYLACARNNLTDASKEQLTSECEFENAWETIYVTNETCIVSKITNKTGYVAYSTQLGIAGKQDISRLKRAYCLSTAKIVDGKEIIATYYLDKKNENDELQLNKALLLPYSDGIFYLAYTKDKIWIVNGSVVDGYDDRKGRFYESPLYMAFMLNELPGWEKIFDNGYVKIYKRLK